MLMAPIFHNNYRSPKVNSSQDKINDKSSPCISSSSKASDAPSLSKYNIFKSALNKGINFLSKITSSSGSPSSSTSTGSKCLDLDRNSNENSDNQTPASDCSSPDSLKTELIFFKPINREPRTPSSNAKPTLIRVPSMRSNASSTTIEFPINSPCPSPFFIPITPKRRSAFTFVGIDERDEDEMVKKRNPVKHRNSIKRKITQTSPVSTSKVPAAKKGKIDKPKTEVRKTRSMDKRSDDITPPKKKPNEVTKSQRRSVVSEVAVKSSRVLRSQSFKN